MSRVKRRFHVLNLRLPPASSRRCRRRLRPAGRGAHRLPCRRDTRTPSRRAYLKPVGRASHAFWRDSAGGEERSPRSARGPSEIASRARPARLPSPTVKHRSAALVERAKTRRAGPIPVSAIAGGAAGGVEQSTARYSFTHISIVLNAPERSGVYALHYQTSWIYMGESANIRAQLLQHLRRDNAAITGVSQPELQL